MGQLVLPASGPVYVDTNIVIYAVEQIEPYQAVAAPLWDALSAGQQVVVTSQLTLLEVLVKPLRQGDQALADLYRQILLGTTGLTCQAVDLSLLVSAARLRADYNLRTPDAIHAASALASTCTLFVTNDPSFRRVPTLNVVVLREVLSSR